MGFLILLSLIFIGVWGFILYEWIRNKMRENELTFKDLIFKSAYGLYIVILFSITTPILLFILWAQILDPILEIFRRM
jgi:hypothetical protein